MSIEPGVVNTPSDDALRRRTAELEAALATQTAELAKATSKIATLTTERDKLRQAYRALREELELLKRRLFVATAERVDTRQLKLEFEAKLAELNALADTLGEPTGTPAVESASNAATSDDGVVPSTKKRDGRSTRTTPPTGRRKLADAELPERRFEIDDPVLEALVQAGKAKRMGFEESSKLGRERGGLRRIVTALVRYSVTADDGLKEVELAARPPELIKRCIATADTIAHIATSKFCDGLPLYRIEQIYERDGFKLDRGSMSRWMEETGATFGATIIHAARQDAIDNAFCIATDATGFAIQPGPAEDGKRQPCRRGHYFVLIADRDHIFFEFKAKETSAEVRAMFQGFEGYVQADAKSVYDVLYRPPKTGDPDDGCERVEVGCFAHARRKFWEAAFAKEVVAREALARIGRIFELDAEYRKHPPAKIKALRQQHLRVHVESFLDFAAVEYAKVEHVRGSLRSALGYCVRQRAALTAFLDDGRLRLDNNLAENALRKVVIIRDSALFAGSDQHAEAAGHILSLIASARLHGLDPETYLRDMIRLLPFWPRGRHLELAPKYWAATRARIDRTQLEKPVGFIDVPEPL